MGADIKDRLFTFTYPKPLPESGIMAIPELSVLAQREKIVEAVHPCVSHLKADAIFRKGLETKKIDLFKCSSYIHSLQFLLRAISLTAGRSRLKKISLSHDEMGTITFTKTIWRYSKTPKDRTRRNTIRV